MTKRAYVGVLLLGAAIAAACCGDGGTGTGGTSDGTMSAMIGDTLEWKANASVTAKLIDSVLEIEGVERSGKYLKLSIRGVGVDAANPDTDRMFTFAAFSAATTGFAFFSESQDDNFTTTSPGGSGTVTIMRMTATRAEGTFTFVAARPTGFDPVRRLAQGKFEVRLQ